MFKYKQNTMHSGEVKRYTGNKMSMTDSALYGEHKFFIITLNGTSLTKRGIMWNKKEEAGDIGEGTWEVTEMTIAGQSTSQGHFVL